MPPSALLVINERARSAGERAALDDAVRVLGHTYRVRVVSPTSRDDLAATVAAAREPLVIAAGGDGTVNDVVQALRPVATLGILPVGTANDFACVLGIPRRLVPAAALLAARGMHPSPVDLLRVNGRPFCTVGGVGLVTRTTLAVLQLKAGSGASRRAAQLLGPLVYKLAAAATIAAGRDLATRLRLRFRAPDGEWRERSVRANALFVVNHPMCGGGLALPTGSRGDDGVFELGIVHAASRLGLARNFAMLAAGRPVSPAILEVVAAVEAVIEGDAPMPFAADGELLDTASRLHVTMHPGALGVVRPA